MGYFNEFPHTRGYDGDLGWLIKIYKDLLALYKSNNDYLDEINQQIENMTEQQLQEWLEDGTLESIILKLGNVIKFFDTTVEMLSANLQDGMIVATGGYYTINDSGDGLFLVSSSKSDPCLTLSNNLYAIPLNDTINVLSFGIDNAHTSNLSYLLQNSIGKTIIFNDDSYLLEECAISGNDITLLGSNSTIIYSNEYTDVGKYDKQILNVMGNNITIKNIHFKGQTTSGGYIETNNENTVNPMLMFNSCDNVLLENIELSNFISNVNPTTSSRHFSYNWGNLSFIYSQHITLNNIYMHDTFVEGIMSYEVDYLTMSNIYTANNNTSSALGILRSTYVTLENSDINENTTGSTINFSAQNAIINNCNFTGGTGIDVGNETDNDNFNTLNLTIQNCSLPNIRTASNNSSYIDNLKILNNTFNSSKYGAIYLINCLSAYIEGNTINNVTGIQLSRLNSDLSLINITIKNNIAKVSSYFVVSNTHGVNKMNIDSNTINAGYLYTCLVGDIKVRNNTITLTSNYQPILENANITSLIISGNNITFNSDTNLAIRYGNNTIISNNYFNTTPVQIGVNYATVTGNIYNTLGSNLYNIFIQFTNIIVVTGNYTNTSNIARGNTSNITATGNNTNSIVSTS